MELRFKDIIVNIDRPIPKDRELEVRAIASLMDYTLNLNLIDSGRFAQVLTCAIMGFNELIKQEHLQKFIQDNLKGGDEI